MFIGYLSKKKNHGSNKIFKVNDVFFSIFFLWNYSKKLVKYKREIKQKHSLTTGNNYNNLNQRQN